MLFWDSTNPKAVPERLGFKSKSVTYKAASHFKLPCQSVLENKGSSSDCFSSPHFNRSLVSENLLKAILNSLMPYLGLHFCSSLSFNFLVVSANGHSRDGKHCYSFSFLSVNG